MSDVHILGMGLQGESELEDVMIQQIHEPQISRIWWQVTLSMTMDL